MSYKCYTSKSLLNSPFRVIRDLIQNLATSWELAIIILSRSLAAKYRQSLLGYVWAFIPPIFLAAIWIYLKKSSILPIQESQVPYTVFVFCGLIIWQSLSDAITAPISQFQANKVIISKINFNREAMLLAGFLEILVDFLIRLLLLVGICIWFGTEINHLFGIFVLSMIASLIFSYAIGCLLLPIGGLYLDISKGLNLLLTVIFFITPIIYPMTPDQIAQSSLRLNPFTYIVEFNRSLITSGEFVFTYTYLSLCVVGLLLMGFSLLIIRISLPHIIGRIGS